MARPKKDQAACAEERLIDAFWELLRDRQLRAITVRTIVEKAGVNRGTFYYHFADIDSLIHCALERELVTKHSLIHEMLLLVSGSIDEIPPEEANRHIHRTALLIQRGGTERVIDEIMDIAINVWQAALCPNGEALNEQTTLFVRYNISGIVGMFSSFARNENPPEFSTIANFQKWNAVNTVEAICKLQGVQKEEVLQRIQTALNISSQE